MLEDEREAEARAVRALPDFKAGDILELKLVGGAAGGGGRWGRVGAQHALSTGRSRINSSFVSCVRSKCRATRGLHPAPFLPGPWRSCRDPAPAPHRPQSVPENKRRVTTFKGICIAKSNRGYRTTFTLRNMFGSGGIERTFPL